MRSFKITDWARALPKNTGYDLLFWGTQVGIPPLARGTAQDRQKGFCLPAAMRHLGFEPLAARRPTWQRRDFGSLKSASCSAKQDDPACNHVYKMGAADSAMRRLAQGD
jgi:hypothetical protein